MKWAWYSRFTTILTNLGLIILGTIVGILIIELTLRIYNPIKLPFKKSIFINHNADIKIINNKGLKDIDDSIYVHKNSLGFRGPEMNRNHKLKIIFVGGSTTECFYISDGQDWPSIIGKKLTTTDSTIWVNNAGISGHSTFGHLMMMDYIIKEVHPDIIFFMVGINDKYIKRPTSHDKNLGWNYGRNIQYFILKNSITFQTIAYLLGIFQAQSVGIEDKNIDFNSIQYFKKSNFLYRTIIKNYKPIFSDPDFEVRLLKIIKICQEHNITPIFITQSTILGGLDLATSKDFTKDLYFNNNISCHAFALDSITRNTYNNTIIKICKNENIRFIDLEHLLPKNSHYYYDFIHYTKTGNQEVAKVLLPEIEKTIFTFTKDSI